MTLKEALDRAVRKEDYEKAARLRDKIKIHGENAELPARMKEPVRLWTGPLSGPRAAYPVCQKVVDGSVKKAQSGRRRTRPVRELIAERKAAVQEELGARIAAIEDMTGEKVYYWDVVRVADMRNYYEEFILDGVCILRVQHFDDRFYL